jgi:D-alanine-D-alanine ligase
MEKAVMTSVLVLGGGPDAERPVSLESAKGVVEALRANKSIDVVDRTISRITPDELASMPGDCIFPVLHGAYGEGGPLQDLLELDGRPYVGSGPRASRQAMDKVATKVVAGRLDIPTPEWAIIDTRDPGHAMRPPLVVKPVHDGSSVGLHICRTDADVDRAIGAAREDQARQNHRAYMTERMVSGAREITVGLLDNEPLPLIEIRPAEGVYDYEAKYTRDDTQYELDPDLPPGVATTIREHSVALARELGARHLARVDFMLDADGIAWLLELNTIPGFTTHSLVPMAARRAGLDMTALCTRLVELAMRDAPVATGSAVA